MVVPIEEVAFEGVEHLVQDGLLMLKPNEEMDWALYISIQLFSSP